MILFKKHFQTLCLYYFSGITSMRDGDEVSRHCGKTAPEDFIDGDSAVELVFHTNQGMHSRKK